MLRGRSDEYTGCNPPPERKYKAARGTDQDSAWTADYGFVSLSLLFDSGVLAHGSDGCPTLSSAIRSSADYIRWVHQCAYHIRWFYPHQPDLRIWYPACNHAHRDSGSLLAGADPIPDWPVPAHRSDPGPDGTGLCGG